MDTVAAGLRLVGRTLKSWWAVTVLIVCAAGVLVLIISVVRSNGTGLYGYTKTTTAVERTVTPLKVTTTTEPQPGKTLWDWMQLLIVPIVLASGGFWLSRVQKNNEQKIAHDDQREAALQDYIDKMSELLLDRNLGKLNSEDKEVYDIARVRTLTVLPRLDATRKGSVLLFLHEARLIEKDNRIIDLDGANLSQADLNGADLRETNLSKANLSRANLHGADLRGADLSSADLNRALLSRATLGKAILSRADLQQAVLDRANLNRTILHGTTLRRASLRSAFLNGAYLQKADLREAKLHGALLTEGADLREADLRGADLREAYLSEVSTFEIRLHGADSSAANLSKADLSRANLRNASVHPKQWDEARSLKSTIMPDGSRHA